MVIVSLIAYNCFGNYCSSEVVKDGLLSISLVGWADLTQVVQVVDINRGRVWEGGLEVSQRSMGVESQLGHESLGVEAPENLVHRAVKTLKWIRQVLGGRGGMGSRYRPQRGECILPNVIETNMCVPPPLAALENILIPRH